MRWFWHLIGLAQCIAVFGPSADDEVASVEEHAFYRAFMSRHGYP